MNVSAQYWQTFVSHQCCESFASWQINNQNLPYRLFIYYYLVFVQITDNVSSIYLILALARDSAPLLTIIEVSSFDAIWKLCHIIYQKTETCVSSETGPMYGLVFEELPKEFLAVSVPFIM